jgi:TonB family protein
MSATSKEIVPSPIPRDDGSPIDPKAREKGKEPVTQNVATLISVLVHGFGMLMIGLSALLAPHRPSTVPVFELVNLEPPKLRPLTPKVQPPPEPPKPEPEPPPPPPEAPKLTPKPTKAVAVKKPEPKVTKPREPEDKTPPKEVVPEQQVLTPQIVSHVPADPRLSFWASRVKKKAEQLWKPPAGIDILGTVKTVVSFKVARDGTIQDVQVGTSSGNADLDRLAQETIERMASTPPIPENFPDDQIQVSYEFVYSGQQ